MSSVTTFSTAVRERSTSAHSSSEGSGFMSELLKGDGTLDDYIALVVQHYFIYVALEAAAENMRLDPVASAFVTDSLTRLPAVEADLTALLGADWLDQIEALPATQRYVDRINAIGSTWAGGFIAHHYTRYLGDLSGGIFIGRVMQRRFGLDDGGVTFYQFDDIADPTVFKNAYREQLDAVTWDAEERERVIEEVLLAYQFNTEVFEDLAAAKASALVA